MLQSEGQQPIFVSITKTTKHKHTCVAKIYEVTTSLFGLDLARDKKNTICG